MYELFLTTAKLPAFTCADVLDLYLHRGSFETVLADEDVEQDADRWCSRTACGQEFWQIMNQWLWNLRLDLGQHLSSPPLRLTEFAPALASEPTAEKASAPPTEPSPEKASTAPAEPSAEQAKQALLFGAARWAHRSWTSGFAGCDFVPQPDGTLLCPAGHPLSVQERRPERNGSVRIVYGARITHCRPCPLREQCQEATTTLKPRQVSAVVWPIESCAFTPAPPPPQPVEASSVGVGEPPAALSPPQLAASPILWGDWPRCHIRRHWIRLLRTQTVTLTCGWANFAEKKEEAAQQADLQTRAQRAHWRLSWHERMARNARLSLAPPLEVTLHGLPAAFAQSLGLDVVTAA